MTPDLTEETRELARRHYIDGRWVAPSSPDLLKVADPSTEAVVATVARGSGADLDRAVAAAARAFASFSQASREDRLDLLRRVAEIYRTKAENLARAVTCEMGAPITLSRSAQVGTGLDHLEATIEALGGFAFEEMLATTMVRREPIGVCGLITPWNWPLNQILCKLAPALASGCTVVLKPSELSPLNAVILATILHEAGVPAGVFNLVNGTGDEVGAAMSAHPGIAMISFTGSTRAGILVAERAAATVKRVTQELGGKSPNILLPDADFETAVRKGVEACCVNSGQSCSAPSRMLVPADRMAEVEELAHAAAQAIVPGDPRCESTVMGPLANRGQFAKVQSLLQAGIDEGARLVAGGPDGPGRPERGFFVRPTVFSQVAPSMRIAREEIFGPVLSIVPYRDEEDAIRIANDTEYGLSGCVQSADIRNARRVAMRLRAGQVQINHPPWHAAAPFGGYGKSGNGREHGAIGMAEFLEIKAIIGFGAP